MILFNPRTYSPDYLDDSSREIMLQTVKFFEKKGLRKIKEDDRGRVWYADFLEFVKCEKIFSKLLTPSAYGEEGARWDTWRNNEFNEIIGFYGLCYWYTWQVTILGLGPIWMSRNEELKRKAAKLLKDGAIFAFGLSERKHGADIYSTEMSLTPLDDGTFRANGEKYYIGNANQAPMGSSFGKLADSGEYVFFVADYRQKEFDLVKNITDSQNFVAEYKLQDYPLTEAEILSIGQDAWNACLNTVNIGKYNFGGASVGICTHAFYEAINHASNRQLYGKYVTDFPHVKRMFIDAFSRLVAMKLFTLRAADYMRTASLEDRRYLLYNPIVKMKVTTQGEEVINLLWDIIAAKGFERDTYFEMAVRDIRALPKLEGTVHVNMALVNKFMANYFFNPKKFSEVPRQDNPCNDDFLFNQGPTRGLSNIQFHDYNLTFNDCEIHNVVIFREQIAVFSEFLSMATPDEGQKKDVDFLTSLGELFSLIVYGQLILENARILKVDENLIDQIFDFIVRDFSKFALELHSKYISTPLQMNYCMKIIRKPIVDEARYQQVWNDHVYALNGAYKMNE